ncbi:MAG TPA: 16S rRNA (adenine(1518)-N(6)/adenine(1519)-N(6))-dimethyltransferase RsmA [Spirochaetota bacterium]|nr:16S rRNA (adenine(1518)-N(6)/adenine(1519)-N(6))-dimethyltransferase RsmA [Spirochaetota bacterium]
MNISDVKRISDQYGLRPNRKLGQNFLIDEGIRSKIIQAVEPGKEDSILEIGPGLGSLTFSLAESAGRLTAVEIDSGLHRYLSEQFRDADAVIVHGDFLKLSFDDVFTKVVSNLPYYCSSEILFRIVHDLPSVAEIYVMLQQEMAERIIAAPGSGGYGALTVSLNLYCVSSKLFRVPAGCFYPRPEVSSVFLRLERKKTLPLDARGVELFHLIVKSAFWGRRKTLLTSLARSPHLSFGKDAAAGALSSLGISCSARGEDLSLGEYVSLAEKMSALKLTE